MKKISNRKDVQYQRLRKQKAAWKSRMKNKKEENKAVNQLTVLEDVIRKLIDETKLTLPKDRFAAFKRDLGKQLKQQLFSK
mmetsp:Transcript_9765/g.12052  ORF Transcript_9765/g.12052 Transcript_9765/m.12052 type:complete len:81 (+) Transcript_9765:907-1149(+)